MKDLILLALLLVIAGLIMFDLSTHGRTVTVNINPTPTPTATATPKPTPTPGPWPTPTQRERDFNDYKMHQRGA